MRTKHEIKEKIEDLEIDYKISQNSELKKRIHVWIRALNWVLKKDE